jgi:hypothetical protein
MKKTKKILSLILATIQLKLKRNITEDTETEKITGMQTNDLLRNNG